MTRSQPDKKSPFSAMPLGKSSQNIPAGSAVRSEPIAQMQHQNRATYSSPFFITAHNLTASTRWLSDCPLLAQSGHWLVHCICPLSGGKRTCLFALHMSAYDPERTWRGLWRCPLMTTERHARLP